MAHIKEAYRSETVEQAVAHLAEELSEATTAAAKGLRFGLTSVNPELPPAEQESNFVWLRREIVDVVWAYKELEGQCVEAGNVEPGELMDQLRPLFD